MEEVAQIDRDSGSDPGRTRDDEGAVMNTHEPDGIEDALRSSRKQVDREYVGSSAVQRRVIDAARAAAVPVSRHSHRSWTPVLAMVAVVALVVVGAAVTRNLMSNGKGTEGTATSPPAPSVTINVGTWKPGDDARHARVAGRVAVTDEGCVYLRSGPGYTSDIVWPAGWRVESAGASEWQIVSPDGNVTIAPGDWITGPGGRYVGPLACSIAKRAVASSFDGAPEVQPTRG
jgi:hypothetical protein